MKRLSLALLLALVPTIASAQTGVFSGGSVTATGSTTARTLAARAADLVNVKDFGAACDGSTNDTSTIQAAITYAAANARAIYIPAGVCRVGMLSYSSGLKGIIGAGRQNSTLKRIDSDSSIEYLINVGAVTGVVVSDLTLDGNKANQTNNGAAIVISGASQILIRNITVQNIYSSDGSYGWGIWLGSNGDAAAGTASSIENSNFSGNGGNAIELATSVKYLSISGCNITGNSQAGIVLDQSTGTGAYSNLRILNNTVTNNKSGIDLATLSSTGYDQTITEYVTVSGNVASDNGTYGIAFQGSFGTFSGNQISNNGNLSPYLFGGVLFNAAYSEFSGNSLNSNQSFGIDAGGAQHINISNNTIYDTFSSSGGSGGGFNIGGAIDVTVVGNHFIANGARVGNDGGSNVSVHPYDGGGNYPAFPVIGQSVLIDGNTFSIPATSTSWGVIITDNPAGVVVRNNKFSGGSSTTQYVYGGTNSIATSGNAGVSELSGYSVASVAGTLVVPDYADTVLITGASHSITGLASYAQNSLSGKIAGILLTNGGSAYTSAPTVTLTTNCSGTAPTATALLDGSGHVAGFTITQASSGCTTASASFSGGGGTGAAATVSVGVPNEYNGRQITVVNTSGASQTLVNNSTFILAGGVNATLTDKSSITFIGQGGGLYEVSRAIH